MKCWRVLLAMPLVIVPLWLIAIDAAKRIEERRDG